LMPAKLAESQGWEKVKVGDKDGIIGSKR